jgi:hypothetical protein
MSDDYLAVAMYVVSFSEMIRRLRYTQGVQGSALMVTPASPQQLKIEVGLLNLSCWATKILNTIQNVLFQTILSNNLAQEFSRMQDLASLFSKFSGKATGPPSQHRKRGKPLPPLVTI